MNTKVLLIWLGLLSACVQDIAKSSAELNEAKDIVLPAVEYQMEEVFFNRNNSTWLLKLDSSRVSGHIHERYPNGTLLRAFGVFEGKREGLLMTYFPNGKLKYTENYRQNKLDGTVKRWSQEGGYQLLAQLSYKSGKLHGEQKKWFSSGELHKLMHMNMGQEEGRQQAFRKNGVVYANYEAKNGRVFGLKRSNLCYELDDEQVVYRD
ncbi:toxin-antitoxin system YwqK family antitoxin [Reichenbachiella faecimaris]|nr:hypothetical protein [Reichenbachiella faecimaris]